MKKNKNKNNHLFISSSTEETKEIAQFFLKDILNKNKFNLVLLKGDLGSGKTTFTQIIGKSLGIKHIINSPTFVIMKKYLIPKENKQNSFFKHLFHLDAYRLNNEKELLFLDWEKIISNPENLIFIEWPEKVKKAIPQKHHLISIEHLKEGKRKFKIKKS